MSDSLIANDKPLELTGDDNCKKRAYRPAAYLACWILAQSVKYCIIIETSLYLHIRHLQRR